MNAVTAHVAVILVILMVANDLACIGYVAINANGQWPMTMYY